MRLTTEELAARWKLSPATIRARKCARPHLIPQCECNGGVLRWRLEDVEEWERGMMSKQIGRPRK